MRARDGKLTAVPAEKSMLEPDPESHPQGVSIALAEDGTVSGVPLGRNSRPPFLKCPTNSSFLVSTETVLPSYLQLLVPNRVKLLFQSVYKPLNGIKHELLRPRLDLAGSIQGAVVVPPPRPD